MTRLHTLGQLALVAHLSICSKLTPEELKKLEKECGDLAEISLSECGVQGAKSCWMVNNLDAPRCESFFVPQTIDEGPGVLDGIIPGTGEGAEWLRQHNCGLCQTGEVPHLTIFCR